MVLTDQGCASPSNRIQNLFLLKEWAGMVPPPMTTRFRMIETCVLADFWFQGHDAKHLGRVGRETSLKYVTIRKWMAMVRWPNLGPSQSETLMNRVEGRR